MRSVFWRWFLPAGSIAGLLTLGWGCSSKPSDPGATDFNQAGEAQQIFEAMFTAYHQAEAYVDNAVLQQQSVARVDQIEQNVTLQSVAISFERPNKLRLMRQELDQAGRPVAGCLIISDGRNVRSTTPEFSGQVLETVAPATLTMENVIFSDLVRQDLLPLSLPDLYPQLDLLLSKDPQADPLSRGRIQLLENKEMAGHTCRRIEVSNRDGRRIYWVDAAQHLLRRLDLPTRQLKKELDPDDELTKLDLWIDFQDSLFCEPLPDAAFEMELPPQAVRVRKLVTSHPGPPPPPGIGRSVPDFELTDSEGEKVDRTSLAGKVVVLDFWFTSCLPCQQSMPALEKVHAAFAEDDRVVFLAVSIDPPSTPTSQIEERLREWGSTSRLVHDPKLSVASQLQITGFPTVVLLGTDGKIHGYEIGRCTDYSPLADAIGRLLDGENIAQEILDDYDSKRKKYEIDLAAAAVDRHEIQVGITPAKIAPRTEPENYRLERLWQAKNLRRPGNLLVLQPRGQREPVGIEPRILTIDGECTVVELDLTGAELDRHELDLPPGDVITFLRSTVQQNGACLFIAAGVGRQQFHLVDADWVPQMSFPEWRHSGIADVRFADLDGDSEPEIHVGYWGDVGVHGVSLAGQRLWVDRSISQVVQIAVQPTESGRDVLWCAHSRGTLLPIGDKGHRPEVRVGNRAIFNLAIADIDHDGTVEWCGLAASTEPGKYEAVGLDAGGHVLWSYPLPEGEYSNQVERIVAASLPDGGAWVLPAADGSIHVLTRDGQLVDRHNYGAAISGLALTHAAGQPVLLVSSHEGLIAWKATPK